MTSDESHQISRRAGVVGFFTFLSRILGLLRDTVVAYFLGASKVSDAFYVAFRIPNLLRRLTAEGALTIAFVPIFTEYLRTSRDEARKVASLVFTYLSMILVVIVLLGVLFAPELVKLIAYGFTDDPEKFRLTVYLTRLMFPYILLISLTALAMGVLNSLKHFWAPAASPILLNLFIIIGAGVFAKFCDEPTIGLGIGVIVGGVCQLALQIPAMAKLGMLPRFNFNFRHPALRKLLLLMLPAAFGAAVYQVNVLIITLLASFLPSGSVSYLWYADRVVEFPLGIFAIAIATATLPTLSDHAADKNVDSFKETFRYSLKSAFVETIPASVGLFVLAIPVVQLLFQRGEFSASDTVGVAGVLSFFIFGMPFVGGVRNTVPAFFAMKDSKTPVMVSTIAVIFNGVLALVLMRILSVNGLALALALSNFANFLLLIFLLKRKIGAIGGRDIILSVLRVSCAALVMGVVIWLLRVYAISMFMERGLLLLALAILLLIIVGLTVYLFTLRLMKAPEYAIFNHLLQKCKQKLGLGRV